MLIALAVCAFAPSTPPSLAAVSLQHDPRALSGEWIYVEDRTSDLAPEQRRPNQGGGFSIQFEGDFAVLERMGGAGDSTRFPLDGSRHEQRSGETRSSNVGRWEGGALNVAVRVDAPGQDGRVVTEGQLTLTPTEEGLVTHWQLRSPIQTESACLYKHADDIAPPEPASARIGDVAWIAGAWTGVLGGSAIEERWSPPGGKPPMEFVLTEATATRSVFENPRHDFPQRIVYQLVNDGTKLRASIGYANGGRPQRFEFERERP